MNTQIYAIVRKLLMVLLMLASGYGFAQEKKITGKITSGTDNTPLPGCNVAIKGTSTGTITDAQGGFSLGVSGNSDVLIISSIGYKSQEIAIGSQSVINATLEEDISTLNEVIVTGYSTERQRDVTGAVSSVTAKDLVAIPSANFTQQLQGRVPGVVVGNDNSPGGAGIVRVRGLGTLGNNDPLYVIDGVPTRDNLNTINQNDIESIQILKDASSASIYGSRAGNGVVIITTKKGKAGEPKVTFDGYSGTQRPGRLLDLTNSAELGQILWESAANSGNISNGNPQNPQYGNGIAPVIPDYIFPSGASATLPNGQPNPAVAPALYDADPVGGVYLITKANKEGTDWLDEMFAPASIQQFNLGVSGGSPTGRYALSLGYFDQKGILKYTSFKRYSIRANTEFTIKKKVRIGENLQLALGQSQGNFGNNDEGNAISFGYRSNPLIPLYDINGFYAGQKGGGLGNARNPFASLERNKDNRGRDLRIFGNTYAEADILPGLMAKTSFGVDATVFRRNNFGFYDIESQETGEQANPRSVNVETNYRYSWTWTNTLSYSKTFADVHTFSAYIGTEAIEAFGEQVNAGRSGYLSDDLSLRYLGVGNPTTASNDGFVFTDFALFSTFGKVNYAYKDKYLVQGILRRDASSRFRSAERNAVFPAFSVGWRFSEEEFMKGIPFINDAKLRYGWGKTGNQEIGDYNSFSTYRLDAFGSGYGVGGQAGAFPIGADVSRFGNPAAKWETTTSSNAGLDLSLFNNRVDVVVDWYTRKTTDLLVTPNFDPKLGDANIPQYNFASMRNRGMDIGINYRGDAFDSQIRYSVGVNLSTYRNEVLDLDGNPKTFINGFGLRTPPVTRTQAGRPVSSFYGYIVDGIFQDQAEVDAAPKAFDTYNAPGKFRYRDVSGPQGVPDGKVDDNDQTFIGNPHPDFTGGINVSVGYKGFDLTVFANGSYGNDLFNYVSYWTDFQTFQGNRSRKMLYDSWRPGKTDAKLPILDASDAVSSRPSTYFVEDGSYLRIRNIQLSYSLPKAIIAKIGLANAQVYLQGTNLFTFTKYTGLDPDINVRNNNDPRQANRQLGVDEGAYPVAKNITFGFNLGF